jgi:hypothetical protein
MRGDEEGEGGMRPKGKMDGRRERKKEDKRVVKNIPPSFTD